MPHKTRITYVALLQKIQEVLHKHQPDCQNIFIDAIVLHEHRIDDANWTVNSYRDGGSVEALDKCEESIAEDIKALRKEFDVEDPSSPRK